MSASAPASHAQPASVSPIRRGGKYLTLFLGAEEYGLDVTKVQEIIRMMPITRVPRAPAFIRGVINLRGRIVPVLELRARLGMPSVDDARETCIVVVRSGDLLMGVIVDQVRDVVDILDSEIQPVPDFGVAVDSTYLFGIARREQRVVLLMEIGRIVARDASTTPMSHAASDDDAFMNTSLTQ